MDITWYGLGCFRLAERGYPSIITDPFDEEAVGLVMPAPKTDIVTLSAPHDDPRNLRWKGVRGVHRTLASPGEYEVGNVFVTGVATYRDHKKGAEHGENIVYTIEVNGISVCHLGELGHVPTQACVEAIGTVHVLLIPVGIPDGLTPTMASEVISLIEPSIIVPMNYKTPGLKVGRGMLERFLKEMGVTQPQTEPVLKLTPGKLPEETMLFLLEPQQR